MKIYGDNSGFKNLAKEQTFFGPRDVLKAEKSMQYSSKISFLGNSSSSKEIEPTLHIHIPTTNWSTFTGILREHLLPWRWKAAYLDQEDGTQPRKILVCTSVRDGELSANLQKLIGGSFLVTKLTEQKNYDDIFGNEYVRLLKQVPQKRNLTIVHPLGEIVGVHVETDSRDILCHIYRPRGLFSVFYYHVLKNFSSDWKEVSIYVEQISEKVLIKKSDETMIANNSLLR